MQKNLNKSHLKKVTIKFCGDSGDGIQLLGNEFTQISAILGNDLNTFPDFPAEIRAPVGTVAGISGFQIQLGSVKINTPGEEVDALVAFNPAALKANISLLKPNGILILNQHTFDKKGLNAAGYEKNPLEDDSLKSFQTFSLNITELNRKALADLAIKPRAKERCKNFYVLGLLLWLYNRNLEEAIKLTKEKFAQKPETLEANLLSLRGGHAYAEASELFNSNYEVKPADLAKGTYRHISGNEALSLGMLTYFFKSNLKTIFASYPITPASDILNHLKKYERYGFVSLQAEDEMSAAGIALGASFSGGVGFTASSGPGITLKMETINLAVMTELPLVVINVQRAGPSTGLPTKTEQGDLLQSLFARHGESPLPVIAPLSPNDCYFTVIKAAELAVKYMTPIIVLSDGYLANGNEPWQIPNLDDISVEQKKPVDQDNFAPYLRDPQTLARPWAIPGEKGTEHRIGGLEKQQITGNVNYDGDNHEAMGRLRKQKIEKISQEFPPLIVEGDKTAGTLVIGWGSTYGTIKQANLELQEKGLAFAHLQLRFLNPLPNDLEKIINSYKKIIVAEINFGQLSLILRANYLKEIIPYYELKGKPLSLKKLKSKIEEVITS